MVEEIKETTEPKKFLCGTNDFCGFKQSFVNDRCFAPYTIRQTCPYILRKDGKSQRQGSKEKEVLIQ